MNISQLSPLIPEPFRQLNVPTTFLYYRDNIVYPVSGSYIPKDSDFIFKYTKINGILEIQEIKRSDLPSPIYTAEEWVKKYFTNLEVLALIRLEQNILIQNKNLGPKMQASKQWLESMIFAQPSNNFLPAPYTYNEITLEVEQILSLE